MRWVLCLGEGTVTVFSRFFIIILISFLHSVNGITRSRPISNDETRGRSFWNSGIDVSWLWSWSSCSFFLHDGKTCFILFYFYFLYLISIYLFCNCHNIHGLKVEFLSEIVNLFRLEKILTSKLLDTMCI